MDQHLGQERVLGLGVELLQRLGVGGVARPGPPGLRHLQLVEQHHLQLLGRAEVDLLAEDPERLVGGPVDGGVELGLQRLQQADVDGHPGLLHPGQGALQRQLHPVQQAGPVVRLDVGVQRVGQVDHRAGPHHRRLGRDLRARVVVAEVEGQLVGGGIERVGSGVDLELALEVADGQVGQVEGALVGSHQVGGELGVGGQPGQLPAPRPERQQRTLGVVHRLALGGVGQPGGQRVLVGGQQLGDVHVRRRAVSRGQRDRADVAGAGSPVPDHVQARPVAGRVLVEPGRQLPGLQDDPGQLEAALGHDLLVGQRLQQPVPQDPELELVEQLVGGLPVPRPALEVVDAHRQVEIADQGVDLAVQPDRLDPLLERVGRLALQLAGVGDQVLQPVVRRQPLRRRLRPDPGDAGQVVAGLPHQRGQLGIAGGGDEVALLAPLTGSSGPGRRPPCGGRAR